ncbi:MAG: DEAD/DEAH box helicase family protein [Bacteroidetes bacterium]|uniref:type I restriction endonuclease subunit R n=1 Tax=Phnomibacter sp. TaxID=2836217 RepID=UPI002FDD2360|nr:DEAD/DEAH box helicase family protein [Bacteroidota bacterium]
MAVDTSEKGLEAHITQYLCLVNGFEERHFNHYNRTECVDEELLFKFLDDTQPQEVAKLKQSHGSNFRQRILYLVNRKIKDDKVVNEKCLGGIINLLRTDITDGNTGIKLKLFYDKPVSSLNPKNAELYEKNIFSVTRQVHFSTQNEKSLDLVVFINGLPVITFELKNELTKQDVKDAIKQYKTTRDPKEELFRLARCLVHFAVDTEQVWMCTQLKGESSFFLPFNKGNNNGAGNPPNPSGIKTDYLWKEILTKDSITNIIQNYVQLIEEESEKILPDGKIKKEKTKKLIFPRYHQLDAVRGLLADAKENGAGKKYLIQHSAGSGKSNSISWLAHQLVGLFDKTNTSAVFDSVIVVTDRVVLDSQIQRNIKQFEQVSGLVEHIDKGSKHLKEALEEGKKIIITTIQKFPYIVNDIGELPGNKFALIIDEAHSGQSGNTAGKLNATLNKDFEIKDLGGGEIVYINRKTGEELTGEDIIAYLVESKKMLTNASYFAFTATPKPKTLELFGVKFTEENKDKFRAFHLYSMKQAIQEHFIVDVLRNCITYNSHFALLKKIVDDPLFDKKKAQKKLRVYVESHELNIARKTAVMIEHFTNEVAGKMKIKGLAKAMVVTSSRRNAVKYKRAFDTYLKDNNIPYNAIVAFSGEIDGQTESSLNGFASEAIPDEFKKANNRFLIVANKYQTGFDQPLLHTMYVDKKLGGVNAVQTLSRLNRTTAGKTDTFVLDFANSTDEIKDAFEPYYETTILGEATDPNKLFDLQNALDAYQVYTNRQVHDFSDKIVQNVSVDQLHIILDAAADVFRTTLDEISQEDFRAKCKSYIRLYVFLVQILPFTNPYLERLYVFLNHLQNKIQKEQDEDLASGVTNTIDLDSYRLLKQGEFTITLQQGDELMPASEMGSGVAEPELELLSNIVKAFNDRFGTQFTNEDKVRKMAADLLQDVQDDKAAMDNISASLDKNDIQNAHITFAETLKEKMINHIDSNFEVFKEYNENPEFRTLLVGSMFKLMHANFVNRTFK